MQNTDITVSDEQMIKEMEERLITQMTLHHIEIQNKDLEIKKLKTELVVVYSTLLQAYVKNPRARALCEDKIREFGGKVTS